MRAPLLAIFVAATSVSAALAVPGEVTNLTWCTGAKDCLSWDAAAGATQYNIYRGERASVACLINPAFDSCTHGSRITNTTGHSVSEQPAPGQVYWFLVTAADGTGEGTYGTATAAPRDSEHNGACPAACGAAGTPCSTSSDCCSTSCVAGSCQAGCCVGTNAACQQNGDCCSGICDGGFCHAPCLPPGGACSLPIDCCDEPNATSTCSGGFCGIACAAGRANCNASGADGCECAGNLCCGGSGEPPHVNGLGKSFDDCTPLGVPGNGATYSHTMAVEALRAWPPFVSQADCTCGTSAKCVYSQTATSCAIWVYASPTAGYVHLNTTDNNCLCPTTSDPTWQ